MVRRKYQDAGFTRQKNRLVSRDGKINWKKANVPICEANEDTPSVLLTNCAISLVNRTNPGPMDQTLTS